MEDISILTDMKNSVDYMCSDDWKQRFLAEYAQLVTRMEKLVDAMWDEEDTNHEFNCPLGLLDLQLEKMAEYRQILEIRAEFYNLNLEEEIKKLNT